MTRAREQRADDSVQAERAEVALTIPTWPFAVAIGLSAWLLFSVELYAGKILLPPFGGSPSVWTTSLCFFTAVLFFGYLYAHLIATRLSRRAGAMVHAAVVLSAVAATVVSPHSATSLRFPAIPQALNVLLALLVIVGPAAFVLSTTSPLLSAWFADHRTEPWWLYALSNGASLLALLAYPFVVEPTVPLSAQRLVLAVLLAPLAIAIFAASPWAGSRALMPTAGSFGPVEPPPSLRRQTLWLLASFVPAGLLSATTTYLTTDHVSVPLLWIGPLGVYLGSFVVAFSMSGRRALPILERLTPAAVTLMWIPLLTRVTWSVWVVLPVLLSSYGVVATTIHGRLALDRPHGSHLTRFYLVLSAGGMLATAFVALVAPLVFNDVYEYPLLVVLGLAVLALIPSPEGFKSPRGLVASTRYIAERLAPFLALAALLGWLAASADSASAAGVFLVFGLGALIIAASRSIRVFAVGTAFALAVLLPLSQPARMVRVRTFFGITEVRDLPGGMLRSETHGTTVHGTQFLDSRGAQPTTYFVRTGPLGDVFRAAQDRTGDPVDVGIVGLGVGTIAAYAQPGDSFTFFEIDPAVARIAEDPRYFTFLSAAPVPPDVVLGDGRLSLASAPAASFDLLVMDAFSSDTIPLHLLTREAVATYKRALRPHGLIAFHLSSRAFDLVPAVGATARAEGLAVLTRSYNPSSREREAVDAEPSVWLVAGAPSDIFMFEGKGWTEPEDGPLLTDDFSDIVRLVRVR